MAFMSTPADSRSSVRTGSGSWGAFACVAASISMSIAWWIGWPPVLDGLPVGPGFEEVADDLCLHVFDGRVQCLPAPIRGVQGTAGLHHRADGVELAVEAGLHKRVNQLTVGTRHRFAPRRRTLSSPGMAAPMRLTCCHTYYEHAAMLRAQRLVRLRRRCLHLL